MKKILMIPLILLMTFFSLGNQINPTLESTAWERDGDYFYKTYQIMISDLDKTMVTGFYQKDFTISSPVNTELEYYDYDLKDYNKISNQGKDYSKNSIILNVYHNIQTITGMYEMYDGWTHSYKHTNGKDSFGKKETKTSNEDNFIDVLEITFRYFDPFIDDVDRPPIFSGLSRVHNVIEDNNTVSQVIKKANITAYDIIDGDLTEDIQIEHDEYSGKSKEVGVFKVILKVKNSLDLVSYHELTISNELKLTEEEEGKFPNDYEVSEIKDLPTTHSNVIANAYFRITGYKLEIQIVYAGRAWYLVYNFTDEQDMDIFDTIEAYYINTETPQILINHSDRDYLGDIIKAPDKEKPAFIPHSIWDLKTDTIKTQEKYAANVYLKTNKDGIIFSYVYIDEFIIDEIISTQLRWRSRVRTERPLWLGDKYTPWSDHDFVFTNNDYLEYKKLSSSWQDAVPFWNVVRLIYVNERTFEMPRITGIDVNNIGREFNVTKYELNRYFKEVNPDFDKLQENPRYKLWAFALEGGATDVNGSFFNSKYTEFYHDVDNPSDPNNFQIVNINYMTDGKMYTTIGDDMNLYLKKDPGLEPTDKLPPKRGIVEKIIFVGATFLVVSVLNGASFFKDKKGRSWMVLLKVVLTIGVILLLWNWFINYKYIFDSLAIMLRL